MGRIGIGSGTFPFPQTSSSLFLIRTFGYIFSDLQLDRLHFQRKNKTAAVSRGACMCITLQGTKDNDVSLRNDFGSRINVSDQSDAGIAFQNLSGTKISFIKIRSRIFRLHIRIAVGGLRFPGLDTRFHLFFQSGAVFHDTDDLDGRICCNNI